MRLLILLATVYFGLNIYSPETLDKLKKSALSLKDNYGEMVGDEIGKNIIEEGTEKLGDAKSFFDDQYESSSEGIKAKQGVWKNFIINNQSGNIISSDTFISSFEIENGVYVCRKCFCPFDGSSCVKCQDQSFSICQETVKNNL